jgi:rRNA maturation endonuclease Nob1
MPRWAKVIGWAALVWSAGIAVAMAVVSLTGGCADVKPADVHLCELERDSTVSSLALVWFIGFLPAATVWLLARARRTRCRICGDELRRAEHRLCRRCGARLIETATRGD